MTIWAARKIGDYPNFYIDEASERGIGLHIAKQYGVGTITYVDRRLLRLIAKRINQYLADTDRKKKA